MFNFSVPGSCEEYIWTTWTHFIAPNKLNTKHCTGCMLPLLIYRVDVLPVLVCSLLTSLSGSVIGRSCCSSFILVLVHVCLFAHDLSTMYPDHCKFDDPYCACGTVCSFVLVLGGFSFLLYFLFLFDATLSRSLAAAVLALIMHFLFLLVGSEFVTGYNGRSGLCFSRTFNFFEAPFADNFTFRIKVC